MIRWARRTKRHVLHKNSGCTRRRGSTLSATVIASRSKHLPDGNTNGVNHGNVVSSSAQNSTARINGSIIIIIISEGGFSTAGHAGVRPDVDDDDEEVDMDGEDAIAQKGYPNVKAPRAQEIEEHQITTFLFVRGAPTASGAKRRQTLIEEREQRGLPQSASIACSWARKACLSQTRQQSRIRYPSLECTATRRESSSRMCVGTRVRRSTSSRSSQQNWSGLGRRDCWSKATRNLLWWN